MRQRKATPVQKLMIGLMAGAFILLGLWVVPELIGVFSTNAEDTYSEWVWDLPAWGVVIIAGLHGLAGVLFVWSAGHFLEGYRARLHRPMLEDVEEHDDGR